MYVHVKKLWCLQRERKKLTGSSPQLCLPAVVEKAARAAVAWPMREEKGGGPVFTCRDSSSVRRSGWRKAEEKEVDWEVEGKEGWDGGRGVALACRCTCTTFTKHNTVCVVCHHVKGAYRTSAKRLHMFMHMYIPCACKRHLHVHVHVYQFQFVIIVEGAQTFLSARAII